MAVVTVARMRVRSLTALPPFLLAVRRRLDEAQQDRDFIEGRVYPFDGGLVFWSISLWEDEPGMLRFRSSGNHVKTRECLLSTTSEAASVTWTLLQAAIPSLFEAHQRLTRDGQFHEVVRPSRDHLRGEIAKPGTFLSSSEPFVLVRTRLAGSQRRLS